VADTPGLLLSCIVRQADIQDRDGARITIDEVLERFPSLKHFFAGGGYRGERLAEFVDKYDGRTIGIVKRPEDAKGFFLDCSIRRNSAQLIFFPLSTPNSLS